MNLSGEKVSVLVLFPELSKLSHCQCHQCHTITVLSHQENINVWAKQYHLLKCKVNILSAVWKMYLKVLSLKIPFYQKQTNKPQVNSNFNPKNLSRMRISISSNDLASDVQGLHTRHCCVLQSILVYTLQKGNH